MGCPEQAIAPESPQMWIPEPAIVKALAMQAYVSAGDFNHTWMRLLVSWQRCLRYMRKKIQFVKQTGQKFMFKRLTKLFLILYLT
jgi:hypothetical protein